jgi:hypothetical protein
MVKRHALVKRLAWTATFVNLVDLTVKNLSEGVMFNQSLTNKLPDQHFFQLTIAGLGSPVVPLV